MENISKRWSIIDEDELFEDGCCSRRKNISGGALDGLVGGTDNFPDPPEIILSLQVM
jgi:hypothetical protein